MTFQPFFPTLTTSHKSTSARSVRDMAATSDSLLKGDTAIPVIFSLERLPLSSKEGYTMNQWMRKTLASGRPVVIHNCPISTQIDLTVEGLSFLRADLGTNVMVQGTLHNHGSLPRVVTF